jgi:hypothetical protein
MVLQRGYFSTRLVESVGGTWSPNDWPEPQGRVDPDVGKTAAYWQERFGATAAFRTMAKMAFLSAGERDGQALARRVRAGSCVAGASDALVTLDGALPDSEVWLFLGENATVSNPVPATSTRRFQNPPARGLTTTAEVQRSGLLRCWAGLPNCVRPAVWLGASYPQVETSLRGPQPARNGRPAAVVSVSRFRRPIRVTRAFGSL